MGFASEYLSDRVLFDAFIDHDPHPETAIIIIIPAFAESGIVTVLDSLAACKIPGCNIEVIVHVNAGPGATPEEIEVNTKTVREIDNLRAGNRLPFSLYAFDSGVNQTKGWGAGLARKVVMDEAVRRFNIIDNPDGIIVSLDADCKVSVNYLESLFTEFYLQPGRKACSIYFEHPVEGSEYPESIYNAITRYELHLRYYYQGLIYSGLPRVFHTVGSAMAVRAGIYIKSGGMNRQQAGEDFYFIQKTIPMGGYFYLTSPTISPSPRASSRVPFGTGPAISEIVASENSEYLTYHPDAFTQIRDFLSSAESLFNAGDDVVDSIEKSLPDNPAMFLKNENWKYHLAEINANTSSAVSFTKRFFRWFNMFKMVKYLNWTHSEGTLTKMPVAEATSRLLELMGIDVRSTDETSLLRLMREMERGTS